MQSEHLRPAEEIAGSQARSVWISRQVFDWIPFVEERDALENGTELNRSYEVWNYADTFIHNSRGQEDNATAIIHFKRAIEFRDEILDSIYDFLAVPGSGLIRRRVKDKREAKHEIMSALGLMRPAMKEFIRKLRNGLIHDASCSAPNVDVCKTLSDFTWYYLRSTDFVAAQPVIDIIFSQEAPPYDYYPLVHTQLRIHRNPWCLEVDATLSGELVSMHEQQQFIQVQAETFEIAGSNTRVRGRVCGPEEAELYRLT